MSANMGVAPQRATELAEAKKLKGRRKYGIARPNARCLQREPQSIGSRGASHDRAHSQKLRSLGLELLQLGPANEVLRREYAIYRRMYFAFDGFVLPSKAESAGIGVRRAAGASASTREADVFILI